MNVGSSFPGKKHVTLEDVLSLALVRKYPLFWALRLTLTRGKPCSAPYRLPWLLLSQTLEKARRVYLSGVLLTLLYGKGALTRNNFYCTARACIFQVLKDIAHSIKRLYLDLNSVTLFMCKNHKGYFKSLWGLLHVCALAPKIQDEI